MKRLNKMIIGLLLGALIVWCLFEPIDYVVNKLVVWISIYVFAFMVILFVFGYTALKRKDRYMVGHIVTSRKYHLIALGITLFMIFYFLE